jgi:hypothetical protein
MAAILIDKKIIIKMIGKKK